MSDDLIETGLSLPAWLPGETMFSLCSRQHRMSGNARASDTCTQLFGHQRAGSQHDFPSRVDAFVARTGGLLGSAETIIRERTLVSAYLPFRSEADERDALACMRGNAIGSLKYRLGLITSGFRANHPLKACTQCMARDVDTHGVAYWHIEHQHFAVWVCPEHGSALGEFNLKANGVERFFWHLPDVVRGPGSHFQVNELRDPGALLRLAKIALNSATLAGTLQFDPDQLVTTYRAATADRGWLTKGGSLRLSKMAESFCENMAHLADVPAFAAISLDPRYAAPQLAKLFQSARLGCHPIRHLTLIEWLFGDWDSFWAQYQAQAGRPNDGMQYDLDGTADASSDPCRDSEDRDKSIARMLAEENLSASACAKQLGITVQTVLAAAAKAGIATTRRPKILNSQKRSALIDDLFTGVDKAEAATRHGISVVTVTTTLRNEAGLAKAWHAARYRISQEQNQSDWLEVLLGNPTFSIQELRRLQPAVYAWLYRNERAWLVAQNESVSRPPKGNHSNLDWDSRDEALAIAVQHTAEKLWRAGKNRRLRPQDLYQALPELRAKLSSLSRLPRTRRAIVMATGASSNRQDGLFYKELPRPAGERME